MSMELGTWTSTRTVNAYLLVILKPPPLGECEPVSEERQAENFARVQSFVDKNMQREGETVAEWKKRRHEQANEMPRQLDEAERES